MPFQIVTLACGRNSSRLAMIRMFHIYWRSAICTMLLTLEPLQCVPAITSMQSRSAINLGSTNRSNPHSARIVHASTHLDITIALLETLCLQRLFQKGHWQAKCCSSKNRQYNVPVDNQSKGMCG